MLRSTFKYTIKSQAEVSSSLKLKQLLCAWGSASRDLLGTMTEKWNCVLLCCSALLSDFILITLLTCQGRHSCQRWYQMASKSKFDLPSFLITLRSISNLTKVHSQISDALQNVRLSVSPWRIFLSNYGAQPSVISYLREFDWSLRTNSGQKALLPIMCLSFSHNDTSE